MPKLELDITDEMMERIEKAAKESLHSPEHIVICILSSHFAPRKKSPWLTTPMLETIVKAISNALAQLAKERAQEEE